MRWKSVVLLGSWVPLASGCNLAYYASHNLVNEPITRLDEGKLSGRLQSESRRVWKAVCQQFPARTFTPEFADGFTDGYADHLEVGGAAAPPTVPPLRYRRANYLTPQGHALIRDYMVGFQYGAEVAVATGKRQFLTVPVLLPEQAADVPLNVTQYPAPPVTSTDAPGAVTGPPVAPKPPTPTPGTTPKPPGSPALPGLPDPRPLDGAANPVPAKPSEVPAPVTPPAVPKVEGVPKVELPRIDVPVVPVSVPGVLPSAGVEPAPPTELSPIAPRPPLDYEPRVIPPLPEPPATVPPTPIPR